MNAGELIALGVGLAIFFAIFGAMVPTVISSLNRTAYTGILATEGTNLDSMRTWFFLGGMLLTIAAVAGVIMQAFK